MIRYFFVFFVLFFSTQVQSQALPVYTITIDSTNCKAVASNNSGTLTVFFKLFDENMNLWTASVTNGLVEYRIVFEGIFEASYSTTLGLWSVERLGIAGTGTTICDNPNIFESNMGTFFEGTDSGPTDIATLVFPTYIVPTPPAPPAAAVPTLGQWALICLGLMMMVLGTVVISDGKKGVSVVRI